MASTVRTIPVALVAALTGLGCAGASGPSYSEPAPEDLVALSSGEFTRLDMAHWARGAVTISRGPIGTRVLRLE